MNVLDKRVRMLEKKKRRAKQSGEVKQNEATLDVITTWNKIPPIERKQIISVP